MTMQALAMMYAMNVGIEALQGKRGSNLWKDAAKNTAIMAITGEAFKGKELAGVEETAAGLQHAEAAQKAAAQTATTQAQHPFLAEGVKTFSATPTPSEGWRGWFDKGAGIFKSEQPLKGGQMKTVRDAAGNLRQVPITMAQTDRLKVGLGSIGLGAGLYGAGMFDPVDPPEPKYPGYNKFYAENPSQFMPYDDPNIAPIDYSKYPEKPYSNIKEGGIIGLQEGGEPPLPIKMSWQQLYDIYIAEGLSADDASASATATVDQDQSHLYKQHGGIASFQRGGRASNQPNQSIIEATNEEESRRLRQLGISHHDPQLSPSDVIPRAGPPSAGPRIPYEEEGSNGGIEGVGPGRRFSPEGTFSPTPQIDPRWFHPDNPRFLRPDVQGVKAGSLIHRLPSKTKVDENNPKNYKRTSGKLVVDSAGKGSENKDTMLAQLADGEFVTKSKAVRGAGLALGANPKNKKQQKDLGARYFYKQMAEFNKLAKSMAS